MINDESMTQSYYEPAAFYVEISICAERICSFFVLPFVRSYLWNDYLNYDIRPK